LAIGAGAVVTGTYLGSAQLTNATSVTVSIADFATTDVAIWSCATDPEIDDTEFFYTRYAGAFAIQCDAANTVTLTYEAKTR